MRQVPASYLILGDGRVARHLRRYFEFEGLRFSFWSRQSRTDSSPSLTSQVADATHVLILLSDRAIGDFYDEHPELSQRICIHFSGALVHEKIIGAHPLMTFSDALYTQAEYRAIPFVTESGRPSFSELFPALTNPSYTLAREQKPLYHALCALSGNFTTLLWEKTFSEFSKQFDLPKDVLLPYLKQITANLVQAAAGTSVLTGPLSRDDRVVVEKHLVALGDDPFAQVYRSFVKAYEQEKSK